MSTSEENDDLLSRGSRNTLTNVTITLAMIGLFAVGGLLLYLLYTYL